LDLDNPKDERISRCEHPETNKKIVTVNSFFILIYRINFIFNNLSLIRSHVIF